MCIDYIVSCPNCITGEDRGKIRKPCAPRNAGKPKHKVKTEVKKELCYPCFEEKKEKMRREEEEKKGKKEAKKRRKEEEKRRKQAEKIRKKAEKDRKKARKKAEKEMAKMVRNSEASRRGARKRNPSYLGVL